MHGQQNDKYTEIHGQQNVKICNRFIRVILCNRSEHITEGRCFQFEVITLNCLLIFKYNLCSVTPIYSVPKTWALSLVNYLLSFPLFSSDTSMAYVMTYEYEIKCVHCRSRTAKFISLNFLVCPTAWIFLLRKIIDLNKTWHTTCTLKYVKSGFGRDQYFKGNVV